MAGCSRCKKVRDLLETHANATEHHEGPEVGATGFEPVTPAVSRQCSAAELSARGVPERTGSRPDSATLEATPGIEPGYRVLQTLASPLGHVAIAKGGHVDRPRRSGRPGSNRRPQPWQGCALPAELRPRCGDGTTGVDLSTGWRTGDQSYGTTRTGASTASATDGVRRVEAPTASMQPTTRRSTTVRRGMSYP